MTTILMVDDDRDIQRLYGKILLDEGYTLFQAFDAETATELLIRQPFDLVLLDINMPWINGKCMREVIREYDKNMKIIVASAYPLGEQKKAIPRADDYFDKSHGPVWLLSLIRRLIPESVTTTGGPVEQRESAEDPRSDTR